MFRENREIQNKSHRCEQKYVFTRNYIIIIENRIYTICHSKSKGYN